MSGIISAADSINAGQTDEAIVQCKKAIEIQTNFAEAYDTLRACPKKQMANEAIANFRKVIQLQPQLASAQAEPGLDIGNLAGRRPSAMESKR